MKQYLPVIQKALPTFSEEDLFTPIRQTHIDSLDIVVIRVTLEKHFAIEVSDAVWYQYKTISEALENFHKHKSEHQSIDKTEANEVTNKETVEVRMPQMANSSLSESWLLKYLGDKHWFLLSEGFNKKSSKFQDDNGNRLYATFVRINYSTSSLNNFKENETIHFNSKIEGFGSNTFISSINGKSLDNEIKATLLTTFSIRINDNNNEINKGNVDLIPNRIVQLSKTPIYLNDYRLLRKGLLDEIQSDFGFFPNTDNIIFTCDYDVNPYYDINGVGLLYFAAYPIVSDSCCLKYFNDNKSYSHQTVYRDIFYFANCNPTDKIIFQLNFIDQKGNIIRTLTSLYRQSDNKLLAKILTVKQISNENKY
jgi:probable biosynthetic protein (TIGR04098 family)